MSGFDAFLGNEKLKMRLRNDIEASRLSHAYIIEGAYGCGKKTLARLICMADACKSKSRPCMECVSCSKILRDQSPDVITVEADKDRVQINVDVIRRLRESVVYAPNDLDKKYYIIPKADTMNPQAQNALLKTLEEPPGHAMFLLLCERADDLLSTIRSRAPILRVETLPDELIREHLIGSDDKAKSLSERDPEAFGAAIKLARGSLGRAILLTGEKSAAECLTLYQKAEKYLDLLSQRRRGTGEVAFHEHAMNLSKSRAELGEIYGLLADALRDLVVCKLTNKPHTLFYTTVEKATQIADRFAIAHLMALTDVFQNARDSLEQNANVTLSLLQTTCAAIDATRK